MKRILSIALACVLVLFLAPAAFADVDLSGMTFDELVALKDQINLAIWNSAEWQEVTVPQGVWKVGEDIPAGKWTVTAGDGCSLRFDIGTSLDSTGTELTKTDYWWRLKSPSHSFYDPSSDIDSVTVDLSNGMIITIDSGAVIFTPYAGKPSLGFK